MPWPVWLIMAIFVLMAAAAVLPREERPNARVVARRGDRLRAEITCRDCGARRMVEFAAGQLLAAVCLECGVNLVPAFDPESQRLIAAVVNEERAS